MLSRFFKRSYSKTSVNPPVEASGVEIVLLQRRIKRFPKDELNEAMQRAWKKPFDSETFFALDLGEGAVLKVAGFFLSMRHYDRRLSEDELGTSEVPTWAEHYAFSTLSAAFPGGIPDDQLPQMYGFTGMLVAELICQETVGLFFPQAQVFAPTSASLLEKLKAAEHFLPATLPDADVRK